MNENFLKQNKITQHKLAHTTDQLNKQADYICQPGQPTHSSSKHTGIF